MIEPDAGSSSGEDGGAATAPAPDEPHCGVDLQAWTVEDDAFVLPLVCESGLALAAGVVEANDLPAGARYDRASRELRWTPGLDQAANHVIDLELSRTERGVVRIGVADRFEHPDNVPVVEPLRYTHEFGLPVFHLGASPDINDDAYTSAALIYEGRAYEGVSAKYRGASSRGYPKRSFTLKFDQDARFVDKARGFAGARRLVLTTTFDDNSYLRQRLAFELWNRLDDSHIPIGHFSAVVYLDGHYQGVYEVTDHVNDDFLRGAGLPPGINMYKARTHDANLRVTDVNGEPKARLRAGYSKEEGLPAPGSQGAYDDLEDLIGWVANASDADFSANWQTRLAPDFEHWLMFVSLIGAVDTTKKNYYLVHDPQPDAPDPRWRFIPWDFNASFGQTTRTLRRGPETYPLERVGRSNRLFERLLADPRLRAALMERYRAALRGPWALDRVLPMLESFAEQVQAAAERDEVRWTEAYRAYWSARSDFISHRDEIVYLRAWIEGRWNLIDSQVQ